MIENPEDIFQQIQNLDEKIAKVSLNHLSRLTALEGRLTASTRHILEIFYTMRTDDGPINGAYDCDGSEFSVDDFEGENNPYTMLVNGNAPVCSFTDYQTIVNSKGSCGKFGLDTVNRKFKVPTLTNILQPTILSTAIGNICDAGLPNITGTWDVDGLTDTGYASLGTSSGALIKNTSSFTHNADGFSSGAGASIGFDASLSNSIYGNSTTVQPQTIYARPMVQLATAGQEVSIEKYESLLSEKEGVVESGTNYIRYSSGLQMCFGRQSSLTVGGDTTVTFAKTFSSTPRVTLTRKSASTTTSEIVFWIRETSLTYFKVYAPSASTGTDYIAIGYWK